MHKDLYHKVKDINEQDFQHLLVDYGEDLVTQTGLEVNRLEDIVRQAVPEMKHVDLEVD